MLIRKTIQGDVVKCYYDSSNLLVSEYDQKLKDLIITFRYGGRYKYTNVKPTDYTRFEMADSQGSVLNSKIKPNYVFEKLGDVDPKLIKEEVELLKQEELTQYQKDIISLMEEIIEPFETMNHFDEIKLKRLADDINHYLNKNDENK